MMAAKNLVLVLAPSTMAVSLTSYSSSLWIEVFHLLAMLEYSQDLYYW